jgi:hypothetical protein
MILRLGERNTRDQAAEVRRAVWLLIHVAVPTALQTWDKERQQVRSDFLQGEEAGPVSSDHLGNRSHALRHRNLLREPDVIAKE